MSFTILGNQVSDVLQGGQITLTQLFETYPGSGQGAPAAGVTIGITAAAATTGGQGTPVETTGSGVIALSESLYQYVWAAPASTPPGDYVVTWTGTVGATTVAYQQAVTVAAPVPVTPAPGVYATVPQYQNWSGDKATPFERVRVKLQRASEDIDRALIGAVYATNANGMPTDPMLIDVLMRATCAQAAFLLADNDDTGIKRQYSSTSMGGVSQTRAAWAAGNEMPPLAPRAAEILQVAGVLQSAALISW